MTKRDQIYFIKQVKFIIQLYKNGVVQGASEELNQLKGVVTYLGFTGQITIDEYDKLLQHESKLKLKYHT